MAKLLIDHMPGPLKPQSTGMNTRTAQGMPASFLACNCLYLENKVIMDRVQYMPNTKNLLRKAIFKGFRDNMLPGQAKEYI